MFVIHSEAVYLLIISATVVAFLFIFVTNEPLSPAHIFTLNPVYPHRRFSQPQHRNTITSEEKPEQRVLPETELTVFIKFYLTHISSLDLITEQ